MPELRKLIHKYAIGSRVMQLATLEGDQPWVCTVYYVVDDELNFYWLSLPERRHSRELARHDKAAVAIAVKLDQPIIGIQAEGTIDKVKDGSIVREVMKDYIEKYDNGKEFYEKFQADTNEHLLYRFKPSFLQLIDEMNFPGQLPQKVHPDT